MPFERAHRRVALGQVPHADGIVLAPAGQPLAVSAVYGRLPLRRTPGVPLVLEVVSCTRSPRRVTEVPNLLLSVSVMFKSIIKCIWQLQVAR